MTSDLYPTVRLFLLGAGFSAAAGLPLTTQLLPLVLEVAATHFRADGFSHLENAVEEYGAFVEDVDPGRSFDIEEFGAWLDWEYVLRMRGSDTFSDHGNQAGLQLRWAIGKVLFDAMPEELPSEYIEFAELLTTSDRVLTLNYDLVLERSLREVGLPYRRFPSRYSEVHQTHAIGDTDGPSELVISKLHGSIDWTYGRGLRSDDGIELQPLVDGPRHDDDPLLGVQVIAPESLPAFYRDGGNWYHHPSILLPPSRAKPLAQSELAELWDGVGVYSYVLGGFTVIGCSLPVGDPYLIQLVHHIATDYVAGRLEGGRLWPQRRMQIVDLRSSAAAVAQLHERFRFMDPAHTDFLYAGFGEQALAAVFRDPDLFPDN